MGILNEKRCKKVEQIHFEKVEQRTKILKCRRVFYSKNMNLISICGMRFIVVLKEGGERGIPR